MERIKGKDITFILTAGFLMGIVDVLFYTIIDGNPLKSFLILGANYMMALALWIVLQFASLVHLRKVLQVIFEFIISCYCCLLAFCWYRFGAPMDKGMIALVTGTNNAEAHEFFMPRFCFSSTFILRVTSPPYSFARTSLRNGRMSCCSFCRLSMSRVFLSGCPVNC